MGNANTLSEYLVNLYGGEKDRLPLDLTSDGVWSHFDVRDEDDPCEYYDLNFNKIDYDYYKMYANWFQVMIKKIRDGYDGLLLKKDGITCPRSLCWQKPFKLSTFDEKQAKIVYLKMPMDKLRKVFLHYASGDGIYSSPVEHFDFIDSVDYKELTANRIYFKSLLVAEDEGEEVFKKFAREHDVDLCINFGTFLCSVVERNNELYYRPLGTDYYVKVKAWGKEFYKPRPVLQILDTLTGLLYDEKLDLMIRLKKNTFNRWISRGIDGYFIIFSPFRIPVMIDEMQVFLLGHFPSDKIPQDVPPTRS